MNSNLLRAKFKEFGMTQAQVAEAIGIHPNSLGRKLLGKTEFTINEVNSLCSLFHITDPAHIFFETYDPNTQQIKKD